MAPDPSWEWRYVDSKSLPLPVFFMMRPIISTHLVEQVTVPSPENFPRAQVRQRNALPGSIISSCVWLQQPPKISRIADWRFQASTERCLRRCSITNVAIQWNAFSQLDQVKVDLGSIAAMISVLRGVIDLIVDD